MRIVELVFRATNRSAIRALNEIATASERTARVVRTQNDVMSRNMATVGRGAQAAGRMMIGASVPLIGLGYVSAKAAINFQKSMEMIHTQAGASQASVNQLSGAVLNLAQSGRVMQGPQQLSDALFHIESVGIRGKNAMAALNVAMQGSAVGGSDAESTATALAAAWAAMGRRAQDLNPIMGTLNATVGAGNMRMGDLVQALGMGIIPAFRQAGLGINDAMGALAVFTDAGYRASSASSQVSTALHFLFEPTAKAQKALAGIGMSSDQMAVDMHRPHGLLVALKDLKQHLETLPGGTRGVAAEQVLGAILPGGRGRIMLTLIQNLAAYQRKLAQIQATSGNFAQDVAATHQTASFKLHAAWVQIQATLVKLGATLLPIIGNLLPKFVKIISSIINYFTHLSPGMKKLLVDIAIFLPLAGSVLFVGGKFLTLFSQLYKAWLVIRGLGIVRELTAIKGAMVGIATAETGIARAGAFASLISSARALLGIMLRISAILGGLYVSLHAARKLADAIPQHQHARSMIQGALAMGGAGAAAGAFLAPETLGLSVLVGGGVGALAGGASGLISSMLHHQGGVVRAPHFQFGGGVDSVLGWLTPGEGVLTQAAMARIGGAGGLAALNAGMPPQTMMGNSNYGMGMGSGMPMEIVPSPVYLHMDGRLVARGLVQYTLRAAARGPGNLVGGQLVAGVTVPVNK